MASEPAPAPPRLSVRGEATLEVAPEIVQLTITVSARDPKRERALELLSARNGELVALLKGYGDAVEKVETSHVAVHPELRWFGRKEQVRAYAGTVRVNVMVTDFAVLGDLIGRASDSEMTTLDGPWWRLRHDSPVYRRVRQDAARDAIVRAREYAEAVGARLTGLVELADEGLATEGAQPRAYGMPMAPAAARARAQAAEPPPIDLEPQQQIVRARVEARFTISAPEEL